MISEKYKMYDGIIEWGTSEFIDYAGEVHHIIVSAVDIHNVDRFKDITIPGFVLGVAICNPKDDYIEMIGVNKAAKNAIKTSNTLRVGSFKGITNSVIVTAAIDNELDFIKNNINLFIKGYADSKKKYMDKHSN